MLAIPVLCYAFSSGPPAGVTGGFNEPNCTDCHGSFGVNSGPGNVTVNVPANYTSGGTYPITVTVSQTNQMRWGFEASARTAGGDQAGTLTPGLDNFTQLLPGGGSVQYISHTSTGTRPGTTGPTTFQFQWTAPNVSAGPVTFSVAGNAANGDFSSFGDYIYTRSAISQPQAAANPTISLNPLSLSLMAAVRGANPAAKTINISNSGGGVLNWSTSVQTSSGGNWLGVSPSFGMGAGTLNITTDTSGLSVGVYNGTITVTALGATNTPQSIPVQLQVLNRRFGQVTADQ
jgi:hypothetical protein